MRRSNQSILYLILILVFLMSSCYSDYLNIGYDVHHGAQWNSQKNEIAFVASKTAYLSPEGISCLPDGGRVKFLLEDVSLYILNLDELILNRLVGFDDLVNFLGPYKSKWDVDISFNDSMILYRVQPVTDWEWYRAQSDSLKSGEIEELEKLYNAYFAYLLDDKNCVIVDSLSFNDSFYEKRQIGLTELNDILERIPFSVWDLMIQEIYPKSEQDYIEETVYFRNKDKDTRRAVVEQIIAKRDRDEIEIYLEEMDDYGESLSGSDSIMYQVFGKETRDLLFKLLNEY